MTTDQLNDDAPIGRILTRREALALLGATAGGVLLVACVPSVLTSTSPVATSSGTGAPTIPECVVRPELTEGPYFVDEKLNRSDIRSEPGTGVMSAGVPLALAFVVWNVNGSSCGPLASAVVDVWHCDGLGIYSDVDDPGGSTVGQKFLRGYQLTGTDGAAAFTTIYPGWYSGRAVHIHFKIRTEPDAANGTEFTSQLFFDDALTDVVHERDPYVDTGARDTRNGDDDIFRQSGGQMTLAPAQVADGYAVTFNIGVVAA